MNKTKGTKMLDVTYPITTQKDYYTLSQIMTIETDNEADFIWLGKADTGVLIGYMTKRDGWFVFSPENDNGREYDPTTTYAESMVNVFVEISNDPALSHELAVLSSRKAMNDSELF